MNVVDSSAWLEYFSDGPNAALFAAPIEDVSSLVVPSLTLFEVFKRAASLQDEDVAFEIISVMLQGKVVELSAALALDAAQVSLSSGLAMADSIILATARSESAVLWTQDAHFRGLRGVEFYAKRQSAD